MGVLPKEEGQQDGRLLLCRQGFGVRVQRSVGSSSRVTEMKKNLAYQPARDPLIWAAYMPRKVGPLGVGAAKPIPHGHAMTNTEIANSRDQIAVKEC